MVEEVEDVLRLVVAVVHETLVKQLHPPTPPHPHPHPNPPTTHPRPLTNRRTVKHVPPGPRRRRQVPPTPKIFITVFNTHTMTSSNIFSSHTVLECTIKTYILIVHLRIWCLNSRRADSFPAVARFASDCGEASHCASCVMKARISSSVSFITHACGEASHCAAANSQLC